MLLDTSGSVAWIGDEPAADRVAAAAVAVRQARRAPA